MSALTESKRDNILNAIIEAYAKNPNITSLEMRDENARIAKRFRVSHMVVAGVASNFTRGVYGNTTSLINSRRRELRKATAARA